MNKKDIKKTGAIILQILLYIFLALSFFAVILTVSGKRDADGTAELFGYQMRIISSDSMAKCEQTDVSDYKIKSLPLRSMVFVKLMPKDKEKAEEWYSGLKVGDVLTFKYVYTQQVTITHRISSITPKEGGGYLIELRGDNKASDSELMSQVIDTSESDSPNYVIGKVVGSSVAIGFLLSLLKSTAGIVFLIIIPCFIIILLEILKIVGAINAEKKKREREEKDKKERELCELRRRLAELEEGGMSREREENEDAAPEIKGFGESGREEMRT